MELNLMIIKDGVLPENHIVLCSDKIKRSFERISNKPFRSGYTESGTYWLPFYVYVLTRYGKKYIVDASLNTEESFKYATKLVKQYNKAKNKRLPKFLQFYLKNI